MAAGLDFEGLILAGQLIAAERRRVARLTADHLHLHDLNADYFAAETWDPLHRSGASFPTWALYGIRDAIRQACPPSPAGRSAFRSGPRSRARP